MGVGRVEKMAGHVALAGRPIAARAVFLGGWLRSVRRAILVALLPVSLIVPSRAEAQSEERCRILCAPELKVEPTITVENLFRAPVVETLDESGRVVESGRAPRDTAFELIFALDVATQIPRIGVTLEAIFVPFGETSVNPFTGVQAPAGGSIRDNGIEIEAELNINLFDTDQTGGWVSSHFDIVDKFSPAASPGARGVYTHKLNFEWDTAFQVFNRLPEGNWLRNVEAEISLDYVATGLPKAGDVLGDERFVDRASPWSLSFVFVFPLAPLVP
jgi:hypothetical protein